MRIVLWASIGCRAASLLPEGTPPRHALGATLTDAWSVLGSPGGPGPDALAVLDAMSRTANKAGLSISLVGRPGPPWTAFVVHGSRSFERTDDAPERALAAALAQADQAPTEPPARPSPVTPRRRPVQGKL